MAASYSDIDRMLLERWTDVTGLIDAHRDLQNRMEEMISSVGDRVARWARPLGFDVETEARNAEIHTYRPSWAGKRRGAKVSLTLGGFCPVGFRKVDAQHPFLWLYTNTLEEFKVKEPERIAFAQAVRSALGEKARGWEAHDVNDAAAPLGRYLTQYHNVARAKLLLDSDALFAFCTEHFPTLFELADVIDVELQKLGK